MMTVRAAVADLVAPLPAFTKLLGVSLDLCFFSTTTGETLITGTVTFRGRVTVAASAKQDATLTSTFTTAL